MSVRHSSSSIPASRRAKVRGSAVLMRQSYVQARFGPAANAMYLSRASSDLRTTFTLASGFDQWVDFGQFIEATELVDRLFGRGDLELAWEVGRYAAEHNMGVWKSIVMRLLSPKVLIGIAASVWTAHYDSGRLLLREEPKGEVRMSIADFLTPHRTHCMSIGGWVERTLELGKPRSVSVRELSCRARGASTCEFALSWG